MPVHKRVPSVASLTSEGRCLCLSHTLKQPRVFVSLAVKLSRGFTGESFSCVTCRPLGTGASCDFTGGEKKA